MATTPYFILSPATVLSALGFMRGPDPTRPTPAEDWRTASVDVIIPALNEEDHIVLCLASVIRQTLRPRKIILVDDGSTDRTVETAEAFCKFHNVDLVTIQRRRPIGKTPTIKRQARELDSDVEFILDADTVLESDNYIERTVQELYQGVGIASACGTILPLRKKDRQRFDDAPTTRRFRLRFPSHRPQKSHQWLHDFATGVTNLYREVLYLFLQRFVYRGTDGLLWHDDDESSRVRRRVPAAIRSAPVRSLRAAARRRPDEFRGHLHRHGDAQRGISQYSTPSMSAREPSNRKCSGCPGKSTSVSGVSPVLLLLRPPLEESFQGAQAASHRTLAIGSGRCAAARSTDVGDRGGPIPATSGIPWRTRYQSAARPAERQPADRRRRMRRCGNERHGRLRASNGASSASRTARDSGAIAPSSIGGPRAGR